MNGKMVTTSADEPSLQLRLVRSHGRPLNAVLTVGIAGASLAAALELDGQTRDGGRRLEADRCRIDLLPGRSWQLATDSPSLACTLNGARVPAGARARLADGDLLEVGLLRFEVELPAEDLDAIVFELRDLAPAPTHGRPSADGADPDPFAVLAIDGARPQPRSDPLAELLNESPSAIHQAGTWSPAALPAMRVLAPPSAIDHPRALFDELHEGFVRVVRDPTRTADHAAWEGGDARAGEIAFTTLDEMSRDAMEAYPLVLDVVRKPETIDQILDRFDTTARPEILDVKVPDEVLGLFAPELALGIKPPLPSLTRREHHALSPDSPMPIERVRPQTDKQSEK